MNDKEKLEQIEPKAYICAFYADPDEPFLSFEAIRWGTNIPLYTTPQQHKLWTYLEIDALAEDLVEWVHYLEAHTARESLKEDIRQILVNHGIKE
jgi:hypothetical protein